MSHANRRGDPRHAPPASSAASSPTYRRLSVLMPIYNERFTLAEIVRRVLAAPIELEIELVAVDDCSSDGSWDVLQDLAAADPRIRAFRHAVNLGKGAAIRTALDHMTGDAAIVQDADLEYEPRDYAALLAPLLAGEADAVFGSRYAGPSRNVNHFWHTLVNRVLTLTSNVFTGLGLSDMETCYKLVRTDILRRLRLTSRSFTFEPELACRLAQWGARIHEVPIRYEGRSQHEGKKIRPIDGIKALWEIFRTAVLDTQFTTDLDHYAMVARCAAVRERRAILAAIEPHLGSRVLDVSSGLGAFGQHLLDREQLVLAERRAEYVERLSRRYAARENTTVEQSDLFDDADRQRWRQQVFDGVLCTDLADQTMDETAALDRLSEIVPADGRLAIVYQTGGRAAAGKGSRPDKRSRSLAELCARVEAAGFEIVHASEQGKLPSLVRRLSLQGDEPRPASPRRVAWCDRCFPLWQLLDGTLPGAGTTWVVVGRRRAAAARRMAA